MGKANIALLAGVVALVGIVAIALLVPTERLGTAYSLLLIFGGLVALLLRSILAKEVRDRLMEDYDKTYPDYGFAQHKGYATADHLAALTRLGPTPIHRKSFAPVRNLQQNRLSL